MAEDSERPFSNRNKQKIWVLNRSKYGHSPKSSDIIRTWAYEVLKVLNKALFRKDWNR